MNTARKDFIPAAGHDRLLRFYDPVTKLLGADRVRAKLLDAAGVRAGERVLDLGCGTGAVSLLLWRREPRACVVGLDPDPNALARAERKSRAARAEIEWCRGYAGRAPFPPRSFDRVLSSLMLHHLTAEEKRAAFRDVKRMLRPGGSFHVLDFGPPQSVLDGVLISLFHRDERLQDNLRGLLPTWLGEAGFVDVHEVGSHLTPFGRISLYSGRAAE